MHLPLTTKVPTLIHYKYIKKPQCIQYFSCHYRANIYLIMALPSYLVKGHNLTFSLC